MTAPKAGAKTATPAAVTAEEAAKAATTPAAAPAAPVAAGFTFEDVAEVVAKREPNPFDDVVASLVVDSPKGKAFNIPGNADTDDKGAYKSLPLRIIRRQLTEAGDKKFNTQLPASVTVRMVPKTKTGVEGDVYTRIEIRATKKVRHQK